VQRSNTPAADDIAPLNAWLATAGWPAATLEALPGDVSPRRYLRVRRGNDRGILAVYPEAVRAQAARFLRTGELLGDAGVRVPRVLASDLDAGLMLLEDLGRETLYERALDWAAREPWWLRAAAILEALRAIRAADLATLNPPLDTELLRRELRQTSELALEPALRGEPALLDDTHAALDAICVELGAAAAVPCHRDYMARNLVPLADGQLAVIDHQDLRLGPAAYDWASLLNDSLFAPPELEGKLLDRAHAAGVEMDAYRQAAIQRGFKAVGTFVAFARRGSDRHLPLVAPTLDRALAHFARLPSGREIAPALRRALTRMDLLQSTERLPP
jgi:aminoglycoside/choline kinase family phosphotransferase